MTISIGFYFSKHDFSSIMQKRKHIKQGWSIEPKIVEQPHEQKAAVDLNVLADNNNLITNTCI